MNIIVPAEAAVVVDADLWAGQVTWYNDDEGGYRSAQLFGGDDIHFEDDDAEAGARPDIALDIRGRAGNIDIQEAS
ncbi:hypothetical protein [Paraoerskovia sediminicola]|uniref:hypothetical protein n=1 Tax=Paraoerskovia sediminicola TaxID=1138587 RepID=UPI0033065991